MVIKDLTRGKYPIFSKYYKSNNEVSRELINAHLMSSELENFLVEHQLRKEDAKRLQNIAPVWMRVKVQFNYDVACLLAKIWKECLAAEKTYDDRSLTTKELETQRTNAVLSLSKKEQES